MNNSNSGKLSKNALLVLALFEGISVMAVELCSAQIISPFYGNNLAVWTTVLGITLIALTIGYFFGGQMTRISTIRHQPSTSQLGWLLLMIALSIGSMSFIGNKIISLLNLVTWQMGWILMSLIIIVPSLILLGMVPPIIINFFSENSLQSGKISGKVFGISTIGNIFSAFLVGFFLIPKFGVTISLFIVSLLVSFYALWILFMLEKEKGGSLIFFSFVLLFNSYNVSNLKTKQIPDYQILEFSEGLMGQLAVIDMQVERENKQTGWNRIMLQNRIGQTYINLDNGTSNWSYVNYISTLSSIFPPNSKILLLGLGGGTVTKTLTETIGMDVTAVELDKRIAEIAKKKFGLPSNIKIVIDDARHFLKMNKQKYSIIIFDTFQGDTPPAHLLSEECFSETKKLLEQNGMILINFYGFIHGTKSRVAKSIVKTLNKNGLQVSLVPTMEEEQYRNMIFVASENQQNFSQARAALNIHGEPANLDSLKIFLNSDELSDAVVLTDNQPIQELWNIEASQSWRQDYYWNITKKLLDDGIPLFK